jgi:hypothetical protein
MTKVKGSAFNLADQGIFINFLDVVPAAKTNSSAVNAAALNAYLVTLAADGGGVVVIPHGVSTTWLFPTTSSKLCIIVLKGDTFQIHFNKTDSTWSFNTSLASFILDTLQINESVTYGEEATNFTDKIVESLSLIDGPSWDLVRYVGDTSAETNACEATQRSGATPGKKYFFKGAEITGTLDVSGNFTNRERVVFPTTHNKEIIAAVAAGSTALADTTEYAILNHSGTIATYTVTLPDNPIDGQTLHLYSRSIVTTLTLAAGSGESIATGSAITTIAAAGHALWIYQESDTSWYRVG